MRGYVLDQPIDDIGTDAALGGHPVFRCLLTHGVVGVYFLVHFTEVADVSLDRAFESVAFGVNRRELLDEQIRTVRDAQH